MLPPNDVSDAQNLEDVRLWRVLYDCPDKFFVDVGASHPTKLSITKWFSERDWQGINIEPSPDTVTDRATVNLENATDPELKQISPAVSTVRVKQRPLVDVLSEHAAKTPIGFLSVNVEGAEADVLTSNDWERYRPRVVVVEAIDPITLFPNHQNWESILLAAGYLYAVSDGMNRFYVAQEYPELLERFGFDFTGRLSNSRPDDYELLNQNNLALIDQLQAAKNSWSFRLGHAALRPLRSLRPLRPLRNKIINGALEVAF